MHALLRIGLSVGVVALLGSAILSAQDSGHLTSYPDVDANYARLHAPPPCPVSMRAQQRAGGNTLVAKNTKGVHASVPASRIHLTLSKALAKAGSINAGSLKPTDTPTVTAARVTVFGRGGKAQPLPVVSGANGPADTKKSLDLDFSGQDENGVSAEMVLAGFTSVQSIRIDSMTLSDGSTWAPSDGHFCRVAPDLMMLLR